MRTKSNASGAVRKPIAEVTPAPNGTSSRGECRIRATPKPWPGPAPPKANSGRLRGSLPRSMACTRAALAMPSLTSWWMPQAARVDAHAQRLGDASLDGPLGGGEVELHAAAEEEVRVEVAEHAGRRR